MVRVVPQRALAVAAVQAPAAAPRALSSRCQVCPAPHAQPAAGRSSAPVEASTSYAGRGVQPRPQQEPLGVERRGLLLLAATTAAATAAAPAALANGLLEGEVAPARPPSTGVTGWQAAGGGRVACRQAGSLAGGPG